MQCRRCKTHFDYEKHYGICPKCAAYNRPDGRDDMEIWGGEKGGGLEEEYQMPVFEGVTDISPEHEALHKKYDAKKVIKERALKRKKETEDYGGKALKIALSVAGVVAVVFAFTGIGIFLQTTEKKVEKAETVEQLQYKTYEENEPAIFALGEYQIRLTGARRISSPETDRLLPKETELVAISFTAEEVKTESGDSFISTPDIYITSGDLYQKAIERETLEPYEQGLNIKAAGESDVFLGDVLEGEFVFFHDPEETSFCVNVDYRSEDHKVATVLEIPMALEKEGDL